MAQPRMTAKRVIELLTINPYARVLLIPEEGFYVRQDAKEGTLRLEFNYKITSGNVVNELIGENTPLVLDTSESVDYCKRTGRWEKGSDGWIQVYRLRGEGAHDGES